jgi:tetratricopeptide (TPR) repeat protein
MRTGIVDPNRPAWPSRPSGLRRRGALMRAAAIAIGLAVALAAARPTAAAPPMTRAFALSELASADASRRIAAHQALAALGTMADAPRVAERLRLGDEAEHEAAEAALWAIWSRSGDAGIDQLLTRGARLMSEGEFGPALALFDEVVRLRPAFAEGWNKRATVLFLLGRNAESLRDCAEVLARNPLHFGALSGMAQIHIRLGDAEAALKAYARALQVNPRLAGGAQNLRLLEEAARQQRRAAGGQST